MKPIKLTISGFITYRDTQVIDFTKFEQGSLFIISGPTGSGKTTIFDAICFALYGKISSQARGDGEELRSQYLSPEDEKTFVEFEFEENGQKIWIRREPRQVIKRPRGKIDSVSEEVELRVGSQIFTAKREADEKIIELTGLTWDQFTKIVMLPQGEFRKFLSASSNEKEEILRKIFDTVPYQTLFEQVKQRYFGLQKKFEKMESEVNALVSVLEEHQSGCIQEFLNEQKLETTFYAKAIEAICEEKQEKQKEKEEIEKKKKEEEEKYQEYIEKISIAKQQNEQLSQFQAKQKMLAEILPYEDEMNRRKEACIRAEQASFLYHEEIRLKEAKNRIQKKKEELQGMLVERDALEKRYKLMEEEAKQIPLLKKEEEEKIKQLQELEQKKGLYTQYQNAQKIVEECKHNQKQIEKSKDSLQQLIDQSQEKVKGCQEDANKLQNSQEQLLLVEKKLGHMELELERYRSIYKEVSKIGRYDQEFLALEQKLKVDKAELGKLEKELENQKRLLEQSFLSVYAKDLEEGKECPLCGSVHHPNIVKQESFVKKEEIAALEKTIQQLRTNEATQETQKSQLQLLSKEAREQVLELSVKNPFEAQRFQTVLEELHFYKECGQSCAKEQKELLLQKEQRATEVLDYKKKLELEKRYRTELEEQNKQFQEMLLQESKVSSELEHSLLLIEELKGKLGEIDEQSLNIQSSAVKAEKEKLHERVERLEREQKLSRESYSKVDTKVTEYTNYQKEEQERFQKEKEEWILKVQERFSTLENYRENCMEESVLAKERATVEEFFVKYTKLKVEVGTLEANLKTREFIEIDSLLEAQNQSKEMKRILEERKEQLNADYRSIDGLEKKIREVMAQEGEYAQKKNNLSRLYQLCSGENPMKATLETYVLMYFFEEVLLYANKRLYKMTDGQYTLYRKEDNFKGNRRNKGLELEILDTNVGKKRSTAMLSGGESFLASLSLALGLSDAIMNAAGQIEIDTLFIDEGFGTLDQDRLQSAVDCLLELTGRNRMIGIISHVEELKSTIPNKIIVSYEKESGSKLSLVH